MTVCAHRTCDKEALPGRLYCGNDCMKKEAAARYRTKVAARPEAERPRSYRPRSILARAKAAYGDVPPPCRQCRRPLDTAWRRGRRSASTPDPWLVDDPANPAGPPIVYCRQCGRAARYWQALKCEPLDPASPWAARPDVVSHLLASLAWALETITPQPPNGGYPGGGDARYVRAERQPEAVSART